MRNLHSQGFQQSLLRLAYMLRASLMAQTVKRLPTMQEIRVRSLGREDFLEQEMATHAPLLPWLNYSWGVLTRYFPRPPLRLEFPRSLPPKEKLRKLVSLSGPRWGATCRVQLDSTGSPKRRHGKRVRNTQESYSGDQGTNTPTRWRRPNWSQVCFIILFETCLYVFTWA